MQENQTKKPVGSGFYSRMSARTDVNLLSDSAYNLLIGLMVLWGFLVNYLMIRFAMPRILFMLIWYNESAATIGIVSLIAYFALCFAGSRLMLSPSIALDFLGYNLIVIPIGVLLCVALQGYSANIIVEAIVITAAITLLMLVISTCFPSVFSTMGRGLGTALLVTVLVDLAAALIFRRDLAIVDFIISGIMSLYIGYDWVRAWRCRHTPNNAIIVAASLYLDIVNIFLRILRILSRAKSRN